MKKHLSLEVKLYLSFLVATAGCLLMLALLVLWTESSWCQNCEKYWSSRLLAWWQLLISALYVLWLVPGRLRSYPVWVYALSVLSSVWQTETLCCNSLPYKLKRIHLWTYTSSMRRIASPLSCFHCSTSGYLPLQATRRAPVGIQAHLPMPAGRQGTSKCAVKCASPAQWDIHCMAQQRGSAFPMGPGLANSRSANVRETFKISLWCYVWNTLESCRELTHKYFFAQSHTFKLVQIHKEQLGSVGLGIESWYFLLFW